MQLYKIERCCYYFTMSHWGATSCHTHAPLLSMVLYLMKEKSPRKRLGRRKGLAAPSLDSSVVLEDPEDPDD